MVGYMRVSTAEQSIDLQRDALLAAGVEAERIYEGKCSGSVADRPGLSRALDVARAGDALGSRLIQHHPCRNAASATAGA